MTKIISALLLLASVNSQAVTLFCETGEEGFAQHSLLREDFNADCKSIDLKAQADFVEGRLENVDLVDTTKIKATLKGFGPGFRFTMVEGIMINCPFVSSAEKLIRSPFYGVKAEAGLLIGANVGIFSNKRLGLCLMTGAAMHSYGLGVSGAKIQFEE